MESRFTRLNNSPKVQKWVLYVGILVIVSLVLGMCAAQMSIHEAKAATIPAETVPDTSFTVTLQPAEDTGTLLERSSRICYRWDFGPYRVITGTNDHAFTWGEDVMACTNRAKTKWVALPIFSPYWLTGKYRFVAPIDKYRSQIGYSLLTIRTTWTFAFDLIPNVYTVYAERTLRCTLKASNHTASCTRSTD